MTITDLTLFDGLTVPMIGSRFGVDAPRTRRTDSLTSHAAADSNDVHGSRAVVLDAFHQHRFFADFELEQFLAGSGFTPQRLRTARHDLTEAGHLEFAGMTRTTPSGRQARVFTLRKDAA